MKLTIALLTIFLSTSAFATKPDPACEREVMARALSHIINTTTLNGLFDSNFSITDVSAPSISNSFTVTVDAKSKTDGSITTYNVTVQVTDSNKCTTTAKTNAG